MGGIHIDPTSEKMLGSTIQAAITESRHLSTKSQLVEYYKQEYGKSWRKHIQSDLAAITGMKEKNIARRFDPSRLNSQEKKNADQYKELGKKLPPVKVDRNISGKSANVDFYGKVYFSGKAYYKHIDVNLSSDQFQQMIEDQNYDAIMEEYGIDIGNIEEREATS